MAGGTNNQKIYTGGPEQSKVTGGILRAPLGTDLPDSIDAAMDATLDDAFVGSGYINEDGLKLTPDMSTKDIKDWSGAVVRKLIETFTNTLAWKHLETSQESLAVYLGPDNVTELAAANAMHGQQLKGRLNAAELPHDSWLFRIKDGPRRVLLVVPDGQITKREAVEFKGAEATTWGVELTTYEDENGDHVLIYTDDGQKITV